LINGPSEGFNESCSGSSGLADLEMGPVAGGLSHKKDGIKQRKFKGAVPEVDVTAKGHRGLLNARAFPRGLLVVACLTNNSHAPSLKQRPFHKPLFPCISYHHSEVLSSLLLLFGDRRHHGQLQWQAARVVFIVGKVVLTLHPPLRHLGHPMTSTPRTGPLKLLGARSASSS
jgi:hypothetical protein